jgi:hypothetical protein
VNNTTVDDPPDVQITAPDNLSTVSGDVTITADASDDVEVTQVAFFVDDTPISVDTDGLDGWSAVWYTTVDDNGSHEITAMATDTKGQTSDHSITVTVTNEYVHIGDLDASSRRFGWGFWRATITFTVHDSWHDPVEGATVYGVFNDGSSLFKCTTKIDGTCNVKGYQFYLNCLTFTVLDISHPDYFYDPTIDENHDPDGDSDGTNITVCR